MSTRTTRVGGCIGEPRCAEALSGSGNLHLSTPLRPCTPRIVKACLPVAGNDCRPKRVCGAVFFDHRFAGSFGVLFDFRTLKPVSEALPVESAGSEKNISAEYIGEMDTIRMHVVLQGAISKWGDKSMKLSTKSRYGVRLILDIALHGHNGPVRLGAIARRQDIPVKYVEQIIIPLRKAGYLISFLGPKGGFLLGKPPEGITVGEIVNLLERGLELTKCTKNPEVCERAESCVTRLIWKETAEAINERLNAITFSDLIRMSVDNPGFEKCGTED